MKIFYSKINDWLLDTFVENHGWEFTFFHCSFATPKETGGYRIMIIIIGIGFVVTFVPKK